MHFRGLWVPSQSPRFLFRSESSLAVQIEVRRIELCYTRREARIRAFPKTRATSVSVKRDPSYSTQI